MLALKLGSVDNKNRWILTQCASGNSLYADVIDYMIKYIWFSHLVLVCTVSLSLNINFSISALVFSNRLCKDYLSTMNEFCSTSKDLNVCISNSQSHMLYSFLCG